MLWRLDTRLSQPASLRRSILFLRSALQPGAEGNQDPLLSDARVCFGRCAPVIPWPGGPPDHGARPLGHRERPPLAARCLVREDAAPNRKGNGPANIAALRRRALDIVRRGTSKGSLSIELKRAGWDDAVPQAPSMA